MTPRQSAVLKFKLHCRTYYARRVAAMSHVARRAEERAVTRRALGLSAVKKAATVGLTLSLPGEFSTRALIHALRRAGKRVAVPVVDPENKSMRFCVLRGRGQKFVKNVYGIPEPHPAKRVAVDPREIDVLFVPGRAFAKSGARLGAGAGYFDRFLSRHGRRLRSIGLAYSCQMASRLPLEHHDKKLDSVLVRTA